jgi:hypothetical protein
MPRSKQRRRRQHVPTTVGELVEAGGPEGVIRHVAADLIKWERRFYLCYELEDRTPMHGYEPTRGCDGGVRETWKRE